MPSGQRLIWLDCLRLLAGVSMLGLHATADAHGGAWAEYAVEERVVPLYLRAILYIARTELFLIISIFLLLLSTQKRPRGYRATIIEQSERLFPAFLFWTIFYAFFGLIKANAYGYFPQALETLLSPAQWLGFIVLGDVKYHMHFLPTLFALLLLYPSFLRVIDRPLTALCLMILFLCLKQILDDIAYRSLWDTETLPYVIRLIKVVSYAGYGFFAAAMLGLWSNNAQHCLSRWLPSIAIFSLTLFVIKIIATQNTIVLGRWHYDYVPGFWADFLMPPALFLLCMAFANHRWPEKLSTYARFSFGIYLIHPMFLDTAEILVRNWSLSPTEQIAIKIAFTLGLTLFSVHQLARTPLLAWTIGLGQRPTVLRLKFYTKGPLDEYTNHTRG